MSTLKVDAIRHNSATSDAITTVADGTCTAKLTSIGGGGLSHRNMIINGGMIVSQRGTDALTVSSSGQNYQVDMYRGRANGGQFSMTQVTDAPSGTGLYNSLKVQVTSADTSIGASEYDTVVHYIEGYNFLPSEYGGSGAKTCTLSFYVKSNVTGTHTGAVGNVGNNRGFGFNYTISSANTWERKTITIPGDTTGSWNKGNSVGLKIIFSLGIGSNFQTANVSTWETRETMGTDDGQNLMASTSNNLYLTGIQFEVGNIATTFEHRSYGEELLRCQRYFQILKGGFNVAANSSSMVFSAPLYCPMRSTPTPGKTSGTFNFGDMVSISDQSTSTPTFDGGYINQEIMVTGSIGGFDNLTAYRAYKHEPTASQTALITASAEF